MLVVTGVGFLIHIYSIGYMHAEDGYYRFFAYLNLFMFSMLVLVLANNFMLMFVGWEGVGLCSYLLIGYYFDRKSAGDAGKKAFIVNRIGDVGFVLGVFLIFETFRSLDFGEVFQKVATTYFGRNRGRGVDGHRFALVRRRYGKERPDSSLRLASRCHGRPHSGERSDSRSHHGDGGRVHGGALLSHLQPRPVCLGGCDARRHRDGA